MSSDRTSYYVDNCSNVCHEAEDGKSWHELDEVEIVEHLQALLAKVESLNRLVIIFRAAQSRQSTVIGELHAQLAADLALARTIDADEVSLGP